MEAEIKDNFPVMSGKVGSKNVKVLRDSRYNINQSYQSVKSESTSRSRPILFVQADNCRKIDIW